jgi:hypothetical protein
VTCSASANCEITELPKPTAIVASLCAIWTSPGSSSIEFHIGARLLSTARGKHARVARNHFQGHRGELARHIFLWKIRQHVRAQAHSP